MAQSTDQVKRATVTIAINASVSSAISLVGKEVRGVGVEISNGWTAADIGLQVSIDGNTWIPVKEIVDGSEVYVKVTSVPTALAVTRPFPASAWLVGVYPYLRLISLNTSTEAAVNQTATRALKVLLLE